MSFSRDAGNLVADWPQAVFINNPETLKVSQANKEECLTQPQQDARSPRTASGHSRSVCKLTSLSSL